LAKHWRTIERVAGSTQMIWMVVAVGFLELLFRHSEEARFPQFAQFARIAGLRSQPFVDGCRTPKLIGQPF
jgi:hypothetical protein